MTSQQTQNRKNKNEKMRSRVAVIRRRCILLVTCTLCFSAGKDYFHATSIIFRSEISFQDLPDESDELSQRLDWPFDPSSDAIKIYFMHVGKAGGMSLKERLVLDESRRLLLCRQEALEASKSPTGAIESQNVMDGHYNYCLGQKGVRRVPKGHPKHSVFRTKVHGVLHIRNVLYSNEDRVWLRENTNLLVFTVRDPVDRLLSAFRYHHAQFLGSGLLSSNSNTSQHAKRANGFRKVYGCFPEFEDVGLALTVTHAQDYTVQCRQIAQNLVQGGRRLRRLGYSHFRFNYQYYVKDTWPKGNANDEQLNTASRKPVAVIRTESQWSDVGRLESLMGGDPVPFQNYTKRYTHGSEKNHLRSSITQEATVGVCCAIRDDIQVYHDLVVASVNLYPFEKEETLRRAMVHCGVASASNDDDEDDDGQSQYSADDVLNFQWKSWTHPSCYSDIPRIG